jgi:hypothetical protein
MPKAQLAEKTIYISETYTSQTIRSMAGSLRLKPRRGAAEGWSVITASAASSSRSSFQPRRSPRAPPPLTCQTRAIG